MSEPAEDSRAHPGALQPGAQVGRWRVVAPLGTGSYGAVYQVEAVDTPGETYALKLALRPSDVRAEREVELLARMEHPNVVRVHDWGPWQGVAGDHLFFVMDFVQGLPLHTWAETHNPSVLELARVACRLALTLDWLHSQGVRHRDLKPEHILIRASDSRPILIDFGVGRQEGASTLTSTVVPPGTVHLRSPEALEFHRLHYGEPEARYAFHPTDDLYALGVCLFRALTGYYPFRPDLPGDLLMLAIIAQVPPPVAAINRRVPRAFSDVVARLLAKSPEARHRSGRELYEALEAAFALGPEAAWDAPVFEWEEGGAQADPSARRIVRPLGFISAALAPPEQQATSTARRATTGRAFVGIALRPPGAVPSPAAARVELRPASTRAASGKRTSQVQRKRQGPLAGLVLAVGVLAMLGLATGLASWRHERLRDDAPLPPGGPEVPGATGAPVLAESPASVDAASMTQTNDAQDVKTSTPSDPLTKTRVKSADARRGALGAVAAACVGAACAGSQSEPARTLAMLKHARPAPQDCPPGALETMKELQFSKVGASVPNGSILPYESAASSPLREGPAEFILDEQLGTLPRYGTTVAGRLFFAEGRIHGWFTEARTKDGRRFPVCMVLLSGERELGLTPEGAGEEPGTVLANPLGMLGRVNRLK